VEVWAYCLMPNHVHLVRTPRTPHGLARAIGETHRQYPPSSPLARAGSGICFRVASRRWRSTRRIWWRRRVMSRSIRRGRSWPHVRRCIAFSGEVATGSPQKTRQTKQWAWSSARAHLAGRDDGLVRVVPLIERVGRFAELLGMATDLAMFAALRDAESTGRPLGSGAFVAEPAAAGRGSQGDRTDGAIGIGDRGNR